MELSRCCKRISSGSESFGSVLRAMEGTTEVWIRKHKENASRVDYNSYCLSITVRHFTLWMCIGRLRKAARLGERWVSGQHRPSPLS